MHALDQVCFARGIAYSIAELLYYLRKPGAANIVAEDAAGGLAGFALAYPVEFGTRRAAHLITIDVAPGARRAGVATALMDAVESALAAAGAAVMRLEVAVDNLAAQQFYQRRGYERGKLLPGYYLGTLDAFAMEKPLSPQAAVDVFR